MLFPIGYPNTHVPGFNPFGTELSGRESITAKVKTVQDAEEARVTAEQAALDKAEAEKRALLEAQLAAERAAEAERDRLAAEQAQAQVVESPSDETTEVPPAENVPYPNTLFNRIVKRFRWL